jgi:hypothetical protein
MGWLDDTAGEYPPTEFEFLTPQVSAICGGVLVLDTDNNKIVVRETSDLVAHVTVFRDPISKLRVQRPVFLVHVQASSHIVRAYLAAQKTRTHKKSYVESVNSLYLQTSKKYASREMGLLGDTDFMRPLFLTLSSDSVMVTRTSNNMSRVVFTGSTVRVYVALKDQSVAESLCLFESMWQKEVFRVIHSGDETAYSAAFAAEFALQSKFLVYKAHSNDVGVAMLCAKKHSEERFKHLLVHYEQYALTFVVPGATASAPSNPVTGSQVLSALLEAPADTTDTSDKTWDDLDDLFELPDVSDFSDAH